MSLYVHMATPSYKWLVLIILLTLFVSYSLWLYWHPVTTISTMSAAADRGKKVWQSKNCQACHQVYGLGGYLGPDLTNVLRRRTVPVVRAYIFSGSRVMPAFQLKDNEMTDLLAYLYHLDSSGLADPASYRITFYGDIQQEVRTGN